MQVTLQDTLDIALYLDIDGELIHGESPDEWVRNLAQTIGLRPVLEIAELIGYEARARVCEALDRLEG